MWGVEGDIPAELVTQHVSNCTPDDFQIVKEVFLGTVRDITVDELKLATLGREPRPVARGGVVLGTEQRAFIQRSISPRFSECLHADGCLHVCKRQHGMASKHTQRGSSLHMRRSDVAASAL